MAASVVRRLNGSSYSADGVVAGVEGVSMSIIMDADTVHVL